MPRANTEAGPADERIDSASGASGASCVGLTLAPAVLVEGSHLTHDIFAGLLLNIGQHRPLVMANDGF